MHAFDSQEDLHGVRPAEPARRSIAARLRDKTVRLAERCAAVALFALGALAALALLTWSVNDPSFNHAVDATAQNLLGYPGAAFADLAMQLTGLAGSFMIPPLLFLSWRLFKGQRAGRSAVRTMAAVAGILLAAAAFSLVPSPESWPLPVGLGGLIGGLIAWLPMALLSPMLGGYAAIPLFAIFAIGATLGIAFASGFSVRLATSKAAFSGISPFRNGHTQQVQSVSRVDTDSDPDTGDRNGAIDVIVGWSMHWALAAKSALSRLLGRRQRMRDDWQRAHRAAPWREPRFNDSDDHWADEHLDYAHGAQFGEQQPGEQDQVPVGAIQSQNTPHAAPASEQTTTAADNAQRVKAARGKLKQGARVRAEQQPSFLRSDSYEFPPLVLLSEPPAQPVERLNDDALEQNARLLEGVLEDFGVRGEIVKVRPAPSSRCTNWNPRRAPRHRA
jgi:S-DNA-T family DNA segregation ATPase FtsK/SpoIIIE